MDAGSDKDEERQTLLSRTEDKSDRGRGLREGLEVRVVRKGQEGRDVA